MTKILIILILIITPSLSYADEEEKHKTLLHSLIAANVAAHFVDNSTTNYAMGFNRGAKRNQFKEANILLRGISDKPVAMAVVKASVATLQTYIWVKGHKKHPKKIILSALTSTAITLLISYNNYKQLEKLK